MRHLREMIDGLKGENQRLKSSFEKLKRKVKSYKEEKGAEEATAKVEQSVEKIVKTTNSVHTNTVTTESQLAKPKINLKIVTPGPKASNLQMSA